MPKLQDQDVARNQRRIERASMRLFCRQGYHGTSVREIADEAGISIGNIYNYYRTKEELFVSLVRNYEQRIEAMRREVLGPVRDFFEPKELRRIAGGIRRIVYENPDYWRLMYIDVIEFGNRHFADTFRSLARGMRERIGERLEASTRGGAWRGVDPALAFSAVYLQFFTYFLVEKLFGGKQHLGPPDDRAISQLIAIAMHGLWKDGKAAGESRKGRRST
jgi:AcrR family transcriptional regulator